MEDQNTQVSAGLESTLTSALNVAKEQFPVMQKKAEAARLALSTIVQVTNDEEDLKANNYLVKTAKTYDEIVELRKSITGPMDTIKELLMAPEKVVSLEKSHTNSAAWRIKNMRNAYAVIKADKIAEENKAIQADKNKKEELARLKAVFENKFFESVTAKVQALRTTVNEFFSGITLENFDDKSKKFAMKPQLKQPDFESWFIVEWDKTKLPAAEFEAFLSKVKAQYTYEAINKIYVDQADPIVQEYKDKLPALRETLTKEDALAKENQVEADRLHKERIEAQQKEAAAKNAELDSAVKDNQATVQRDMENEQLNAEFESQVASQNVGELSGVRKTKGAKITGPPAKIVEILSRVLFACYQNPNFEGHLKRDKTSRALLVDDQGNAIYTDWAERILSFWANNASDAAIDGIETYEKITAVNKKAV